MYLKRNILETRPTSSHGTFRQKRKNLEGQGVVEFVIVSSSILFFIFLFINLCYVFLVTQYIDYAVYMSARSLYAAHGSVDVQRAFAQKTLKRMLGLERGGTFGPLVTFKTDPADAVRATANYPNPKRAENTIAGVRMEYEVPVFMIPPIGIIKAEDLAGISRMILVSETYLDREPSQDECYEYLKAFIDKHFPYLTSSQRNEMWKESSDNGC